MRNVEVDVLGAVVFLAAEGDGKPDLPRGSIEPLVTSVKGLEGMSRS